jgi:hypothetical protein
MGVTLEKVQSQTLRTSCGAGCLVKILSVGHEPTWWGAAGYLWQRVCSRHPHNTSVWSEARS